MLVFQVVYEDSGIKYTFPFEELLKKVIKDQEIDKIKTVILKEVQKL